LAHRLPARILKRLVGRKDIEDALQTLEKVTVEEARMAAAEALKAIHGVSETVEETRTMAAEARKAIHNVGDKVEDGIHDAVKAVEGMIQGVDDRVKEIGEMVISGA
jgi:methyl-accepting chemotaxis protein